MQPPSLGFARTPQSRSTYKTDQKQDLSDDPVTHISSLKGTPKAIAGNFGNKTARVSVNNELASHIASARSSQARKETSSTRRVQSSLGIAKARDSQKMAAILQPTKSSTQSVRQSLVEHQKA